MTAKHVEKNGRTEKLAALLQPTLDNSVITWRNGRSLAHLAIGRAGATKHKYVIERGEVGGYRWTSKYSAGPQYSMAFESIEEAKADAERQERKEQGAAAVIHEAHAGTKASLEDQMAAQLGGFVSKAQALQKDVDAILLVNKPFPASSGTEMLDLDRLVESPKNPRQDFDEEDIEGLAKSIVKTGGLMVAILARPIDEGSRGDLYEIADGARRFRALKLLKKQGHELGEKALVDIRPLTDEQLAEAFMTADRRKTLKPLEQARGFQNMLDVGHTVETIASCLGVSTGTVRGRLVLLNLGKKASKLLLAGELPGAVATKIAQYPEDLQDEALEDLADQRVEGEEITDISTGEIHARRAIDYLQENFTRSLKSTAFDQKAEDLVVDQSIWPDRPLAGDEQVCAPSCAKCPRNSKNMPKELAGEDPSGEKRFGFCTLPPCFTAKVEAAATALEAKAKEEGLKLLTSQQVWKELRDGANSSLPHTSTFVKLDSIAPADSQKRTYRQVLDANAVGCPAGAEMPTVHVALTEKAGRIDLMKEADLLNVLAPHVAWAKDAKKAKKATAARRSSNGPSKAAMEREAMKHRAREKVRETVFRKVVEKYRAHGPDLEAVRAMIGMWNDEGPVPTSEVFGFKSNKELEAWIEKKATMPELLAVLYVVASANEYSGSYRTQGYDAEIERAAKVVKVDLKKLEKHELEALQAAAKAKAGETETTEEGDE